MGEGQDGSNCRPQACETAFGCRPDSYSEPDHTLTGRHHLRLAAGMTKPRIFIASAGENLKLANAIQSNLDHDAECTVWSQGVMRLSRNTMHNLLEQLSKSDFGIFVFNSDDV